MSRENRRDFPASRPPLEILARYLPTASFDMSPTAENLERFVRANSLALSANNREIMTLQDIARKGYAHLYMDGRSVTGRSSPVSRRNSACSQGKGNCTATSLIRRGCTTFGKVHGGRRTPPEKGRDPQGYAIRSPKDGQVCGKDTGHGGMPGKGHDPPSSGEKKKEPARKQKGPAFRKVKPQL